MKDNNFAGTCLSVRKTIVETAFECGGAVHIGGSLSMVELLVILYSEFLQHDPRNPEWLERDLFILSKGHAVLGYLAVLQQMGYFSREKLKTFQTNGSDFIAHPVKNPKFGIESSNGSLGQGLSYGLGCAIGFQKRDQDRTVYVLLGDGECNEGSVWETAALAGELEVSNLVAIVDENGFRNDGENEMYRGKIELAGVWKAFGWNVFEVDGHDYVELQKALDTVREEASAPTAIVAKTTKGKGISFMENDNEWHHNRITQSVYEKCLEELAGND